MDFDVLIQWLQNIDWLPSLLKAAGISVLMLFVGAVGVRLLYWLLRGFAPKSHANLADRLGRKTRRPMEIAAGLLLVKLVVPIFQIPDPVIPLLHHALALVLISAIAYVAMGAVIAFRDSMLDGSALSEADNLRARRTATQVRVLGRILTVLIWCFAIASMLMTFSGVRQIGVSLLASAGITGVIFGLAAQKTLGNLFAGIQIAITQPIRIDDVVVVEGEWGRIEEITLTFVVVRIWDLRRLVLPINYFIENPFQNWTRVSADILGTIYLYTDYTVPVDAIREETKRIVEQTANWDGKVCVVQVTNCTPEVMEVRLLVSAADSPTAWTLRCHVREQILSWIQREHPEALPRTRAELENFPGDFSRQQPGPDGAHRTNEPVAAGGEPEGNGD